MMSQTKSVYVPTEHHNKLKEISGVLSVSLAEVVQRATGAFIDDFEARNKETLSQIDSLKAQLQELRGRIQ